MCDNLFNPDPYYQQGGLADRCQAVALSWLVAKPLTYVRVHRRWIVSSFASFETTFDFEDEGVFYLQQMRPPYVALELGRVAREGIAAAEPDCRKWFLKLSELSAPASRSARVGPNSGG